MGPIEIVLIFVLPAVLILVGAGIVIVRRPDAKLRWIVGVLLWTLAALLVIYVITAILSRMITETVAGVPIESTTTVTQEFRSIDGVGSEPSEPLELLSEGLWVVSVHFIDYEPPEVGDIPTANINSVNNGRGGAGWSGRSWTHIYVTADRDVEDDIGFPTPIATFTPGEVVVHIADLPDDVTWWMEFERLGELKLSER